MNNFLPTETKYIYTEILHKYFVKKYIVLLCEEIELILVLFLLLLNIFDLFEILPPTLDYLDKLAGVIIIGYLIYQASPSKIILGRKNRHLDLGLITSFVLLMLNKIIRFTAIGYEILLKEADNLVYLSKTATTKAAIFTIHVGNVAELTTGDFGASFYRTIMEHLSWTQHTIYFAVTDGRSTEILAATMQPFSIRHFFTYLDGSFFYFARFVVQNQAFLERISVYIGGILLLFIAIYTARSLRIYPNSMLHVIHGDAKLLHAKPLRSIVILFVFCFFFLFIFSLMIEWLGIVTDAPIVVVGLLVALVAMIWYKKGRSTSAFLTRVGETGEEFYHHFISLFHTPYGLALGLSGILLLHMLTDFGMYILPYTIYQHEMTYFDQGATFFSTGHEPLFGVVDLFTKHKTSILFTDLAQVHGFFADASVLWIYLFNFLSLVFLFFAPAYIWWILFKRKKAHDRKFILVLTYMALIIFITFPLIRVGKLNIAGLVGADITTLSIFSNGFSVFYEQVIALSLVVGLSVFFLSYFHFLRRELVYLSFAVALIFFGIYISYYFIDTLEYYVSTIFSGSLNPFFLLYFIVFALITVMFYPIAYFLFVYEVIKHYRLAKKE